MIRLRKLIIVFILSVNGLFAQVTVELLVGETEGFGSGNQKGVLNTWYHDYKVQGLYLASDLTSAGVVSGALITDIGIKVKQAPGRHPQNWRIAYAHHSSNTLNVFQTTTVVYGPQDFQNTDFIADQWKMFTLDTPIPWNGTDNLLIEFSIDDWYYAPGGGVYNRQVNNRGVLNSTDSGAGVYPFTGLPATSVSNVPSLKITHSGAGIILDPVSPITTTEAGGTATFNLKLNTAPTADVTIGLSSSDDTEGTPNPTSLTFTSSNYATNQTVTVTGVDDAVDDGNVSYQIVTAAATSADPDYNGLDGADMNVVNNNDDTAAIVPVPTSGLITTESGGTATFSVTLATPPTVLVTVLLNSSNTLEGMIDPWMINFRTSDWNVPQTATVTGVDDLAGDGDQAYQITGTGSTADPGYSSLAMPSVTVINLDNDTPGITITQASGLTTTEGGGTASFTVQLNNQPWQNVGLTLSSSDPTEGAPSPTLLTFTAANWISPQTVTITGADDNIDDGDISFNITGTTSSADANYNNFTMTPVSVTNSDDDTKGITVGVSGTPTTTEAGGTSSFTVVLDSEPTSDVSIGLTTSDNSEGVVSSAATLTFTNLNWNTAQTVTVTGIDDNAVDGDITYRALTNPASSSDPNYGGDNPDNVDVINQDDDAIGFKITPNSGLTTTEAGGTATFTVKLRSQPSESVSTAISSSDLSEGTVAPTSLTFTTSNFNIAQTVTVTGVDDEIWDPGVSYTIVMGAAISSDTDYNGNDPADVSVNNTDDEVPAFIFTPSSGLVTDEGGGGDKFTAALNGQPSEEVTVSFLSDDLTEATVSPASLNFTSTDWSTAQTVYITGENDNVSDGDINYTINVTSVSSDANFGGLSGTVPATNTDDDVVGITVNPIDGLSTSEAGAKVTFTVVLNSEPSASASVQLALLSSDQTEGTVSPTILSFTSTDWNTSRTVTVTGKDDKVVDPDEAYEVVTWPAVSTDPDYSGMDPPNVAITNIDDDVAGIRLTPSSGLSTTETGESDDLTVELTTEPGAGVTITVSSDDESEGQVSPTSLSFGATDWNTPQTVTVTGVDDLLADDDIVYNVVTKASSTDNNYNSLAEVKASAININDDPPGIHVDRVGGLTTTESGGESSFSVMLLSGPSADVSIDVSSSDETEGTISLSSLTFTTGNWSTAQTVTATGVSDLVDDGDIKYNIVTGKSSSTDTDYNDLEVSDVEVTNSDDDSTAFVLSAVSGLSTTEAGGTATFTVALNSQPTADVTVSPISNDLTEGLAIPGSMIFTSTNWNTAQTVTLSGLNDDIDDGDIGYSISVDASSDDATYDALSEATVAAINSDDDIAGLTISGTSGLVTTEAGGDTSITVVLDSEPTSNVDIVLASSDSTEGLTHSNPLVFTAETWNIAQELKLVGQDDYVDEGDISYTIAGAARSSDTKYNNLALFNISATNTDDDSSAVLVSTLTPLITSEGGFPAKFTIALNSEPTADVQIAVLSSDEDEGKVSPSILTFKSTDWDADTVTVTGQNDQEEDGDTDYSVVIWPALSQDEKYSGLDASDLTLTNLIIMVGVSHTELDFGKVRRDSSKTLSFSISDTGLDTLVASKLNFTNSDFFAIDSSLKISPSTSYTVNLTFKPTSINIYLDTLTVPFNLPKRDNPTVILRGAGIKPTITASVTEMNFDSVLVREPRMISFDIVNSGNDTLSVDSLVNITSYFSPTPDGIVKIPPDDTLRANVIFLPDTGGVFNDTLTIYSDDPDQQNVVIPMAGIGLTYPSPAYYLTSFGITTTPGREVVFEQSIVNEGDHLLEFFITVDDSSASWLSLSPESGEVAGHDTLVVALTVTNTETVGEGMHSGILLFTTNSGENLQNKTDSVEVDLKILSSEEQIASGTAAIPGGDPGPVTVLDSNGNPLHVSLDFSSGNGGTVAVTYYPTTPLYDIATQVIDPDSLIGMPILGNIHWEVESELAGGDTVDLSFELYGLTGVQSIEKLRLGQRSVYAGRRVAWDLVPLSQTMIDEYNRTITAINQTEFSQWTVISDSSENTFIDNNPPTLSNLTFVPDPPQLGDDLTVTLSVADESSIDNVVLNYLIGGEPDMQPTAMSSVGSNNYEAKVEGMDITVRGIAFYVAVTDLPGYVGFSDTLSPEIQFPENQLSTTVKGSAFKQGIPKSKWRLISVPAELDDPSAVAIFGDELNGKPSKTKWRIMEHSDLGSVDVSSVETGMGYWLYQQVKKDIDIRTGSGRTVDYSGTVLELKSGWNTIGSPYPFPVNIVKDPNFLYGPISYGISGYEGWTDEETQLKPWAGYAIYNRTSFTQTLTIQPIQTDGRLYRVKEDSYEGWQVKLMARGDTYADPGNIIGRVKGAREELDMFDNPEPPTLPEYVSMTMARPEWKEKGFTTLFTSDIRSLETRDGIWDVEVHVKGESGPIEVSYDLYGTFPAEDAMVVLDMTTRNQYNILESQTFEINEYSEDFPYKFKIFSGSPEFVASAMADALSLLPDEFTLRQNYPNPFNPSTTIEFTLPRPTEISLVIYNLMGQEVRTLKRGMTDTGHHSILWHGKDNRGQLVSSGIYLVRFYSPEFTASHKMVLMK